MARVRRGLMWVTGAWLGFLVALPLLWAGTGETWWPLIFLRYAPPLGFMLPGAALVLLCVAARAWRASAVAALAAFTGVYLASPALCLNPREGGPRPLRVMSYNVEAGVEGLAHVANTIREQAPDVLFLQEARETTRGAGPDPAPRLLASLPEWTALRGEKTRELMILTRGGTLEKVDETPLGAGRCALVCRLRREGVALRLIDVHLNVSVGGRALFTSGWGFREYLAHTAQVRRDQLGALLTVLDQSPEPTILAGDFNSTPSSEISTLLRDRLDDTFQSAGLGFGWTYACRRPLWRIDYIYASPGLSVARSFVPDVEGSDHLPVVSDLVR